MMDGEAKIDVDWHSSKVNSTRVRNAISRFHKDLEIQNLALDCVPLAKKLGHYVPDLSPTLFFVRRAASIVEVETGSKLTRDEVFLALHELRHNLQFQLECKELRDAGWTRHPKLVDAAGTLARMLEELPNLASPLRVLNAMKALATTDAKPNPSEADIAEMLDGTAVKLGVLSYLLDGDTMDEAVAQALNDKETNAELRAAAAEAAVAEAAAFAAAENGPPVHAARDQKRRHDLN